MKYKTYITHLNVPKMKIYRINILINITSDNLLLQLRERNLLSQNSIVNIPSDNLLLQLRERNLLSQNSVRKLQ